MAGMLWTTSPSDDTRTIKIFCTLDTVGAVGLDGAWTILRWAEFTAGARVSGWFLLALGGCLLAPADGFWVCRGGWSWVDGRVHGVFGLSGRGQCRVAAFRLSGLLESDFLLSLLATVRGGTSFLCPKRQRNEAKKALFNHRLVQYPLNRFNNYLAVNKAPGA